jgi:hypothetical protein
MAKRLPMNPKLMHQISNSTIRDIYDGLVELITNSDDSYRRMEAQNGKIEIYVKRGKNGKCEQITVKDYAEGMSKDELEDAIVFGAETSGRNKGKSVRGFFGRGLKEAIIAMGEGEIKTVKDGVLSKTIIRTNPQDKQPEYDDEMLNATSKTTSPNGTKISIKITNPKFKSEIPKCDTFEERLKSHYALRDIFASDKREIVLTFDDQNNKNTKITREVKNFPTRKENKLLKRRFASVKILKIQ